jgi:hypothetical protein
VQAKSQAIENCFLDNEGFRSVVPLALHEDEDATVAQRRRLDVPDRVFLKFDAMTDAPPANARAFQAELVSSLVKAGLSSNLLALLTLNTNLSSHVVEIGGPQHALGSVRRATARSLRVAGLSGRTMSPAASMMEYHISVRVTCQVACPVVDNAQLTRCIQSTAFVTMTVRQAEYSAGGSTQWMFRGVHLNMPRFSSFLSGGPSIPFWSDLSSQQQLVWGAWALVPMCIVICGSISVCCCQRKKDRLDRDFALVSNIETPSPVELSGQPLRAYGDGDRYYGQEPFLIPERELTPGLEHLRPELLEMNRRYGAGRGW